MTFKLNRLGGTYLLDNKTVLSKCTNKQSKPTKIVRGLSN